jgi:hypothetical protein
MDAPSPIPGLAAALLDPARRAPPGLRTWNGSDPARRFAVHRRNVTASLIGALADAHPVVRELVGPGFFEAMAAAFVSRHPPRSPVLALYGSDFADFVADFESAASVPYLAEVARLEFARVRAFHAADAPGVTAAALEAALLDRAAIGTLRFVPHPSLQVIGARHAIVSIWAAHQPGGGDLAAVDAARPETALVLRDGLQVLVYPLAPGAAAFVDAALRGRAFAAAAAAGSAAQADFDLPGVLALLLGHGAVQALSPAGAVP